MPIRKVRGGFKWGKHGAVYKSRAGAARQAAAAHANGFRGDSSDPVTEAHVEAERSDDVGQTEHLLQPKPISEP